MILVFVGAPGAGKGTQAARFIENDNFVQLSTGDMFRDLLKNGKDEFATHIKNVIESGKLVSDEDTSKLLKLNLEKTLDTLKNDQRIILDGYPRTVVQTKHLEKILDELGQKLDKVIEFDIDESLLINRLTNRRVCPKDGTTYHLINMPPKVEGKCDICGSDLIQRGDDTEEKIKVRLETYHELTQPILGTYEKEGKLIKVDSSGDANKVYEDLKGKLNI